jgi:hypothetical protein
MEVGYPLPPSRPPQSGLDLPELQLPHGFQLPQLQPIQLPTVPSSQGEYLPPMQSHVLHGSRIGGASTGSRVTLPSSRPYVSSSGRTSPSSTPLFAYSPEKKSPRLSTFALPQTVRSVSAPPLERSPPLLAPNISVPRFEEMPGGGCMLPRSASPVQLPRARLDFDSQIANLLASRYPDIFEELAKEISESQGFEEYVCGDF